MKKLSRWAKMNPKSSRIIIALSHFLIVINAVCFGMMLFVFNWGESKWLLAAVANLFFISYIFYPRKSNEGTRYISFYVRQKIHDFSLAIFYSMVISFGVNNFLIQNNTDANLVQQASAKFIVDKPTSENQTTDRSMFNLEAKGKVKELKMQIRHVLLDMKNKFKKQNDKKGVAALKILLTILTIGVAIFLGLVIAALSCNLSCSGNEGLAFVVLVLGWGVIIWLAVIAFRNIFRKRDRRKKGANVIQKN